MKSSKQPEHKSSQIDEIYLESAGSLASRIDAAWIVYKDTQHSDEARKKAFSFLADIFGIASDSLDLSSPISDIENQLSYLMKKRDKYKLINPEYVPAQSPFYPAPFYKAHTRRPENNTKASELKNAIETHRILEVNDEDTKSDANNNKLYLKPEERWQYRVQLTRGIFKQNGKIFDTSEMISHHKGGFASFTLNINGELSLFNHWHNEESLVHSSMNAGAPVLCAGELKIQNGILQAITTYSGHYQPSIFNVYHLLKYFSKNGIDIHNSEIKILSEHDIGRTFAGIESQLTVQEDNQDWFSTPANQLYRAMGKGMQRDMNNIIVSIETKLPASCQSESPLDKELTQLIHEFEDVLGVFKTHMGQPEIMTPFVFKYKSHELKNIISSFEERYITLLEKHTKKMPRYTTNCFTMFKVQLKKTKYVDEDMLENYEDFSKMKSMW